MKALLSVHRLSSRERYALAAAALFLCFFLPIWLLYLPALERLKVLERALPAESRRLAQMNELTDEFERLYSQQLRFTEELKKQKGEAFSFLAYLESLAVRTGIGERIRYMKPSTSSLSGPYERQTVMVKFGGISRDQLARMLYELEDPGRSIRIKRVLIKKVRNDKEGLDVTMELSTLRWKGETKR